MNTTLTLIIFILTASVIFPAIGYYMDYRKHRRDRTVGLDESYENQEDKPTS